MPVRLDPIAEAIAPSEGDTATARQSSRQLAQLLADNKDDTLHLHLQGADDTSVAVSSAALRALLRILEEMEKGNAVTILSTQQELTPQQAATFLGMSRTLLNSLLDRQEIPYRYVGSHKRIRLPDLLAFRAEQERRHQAMLELIAETEALGLYS